MAQQMKSIEDLMQMWQKQFPASVDWGEVHEADLPPELIRGTRRTYGRPGVATKGKKPYYTGQEFFTPEEAHYGRQLHRLTPEGAKQAMSSLGGIIQQHTAGMAGIETAGVRENIMTDALQKMGRLIDPKVASTALDEIGGQADKDVATVAQAAPTTSAHEARRLKKFKPEYRGTPWMMKVLEYLMDPRDLEEADPLKYATP